MRHWYINVKLSLISNEHKNTDTMSTRNSAIKSIERNNTENNDVNLLQPFYKTFELFQYSLPNVFWVFLSNFIIFLIGSAMRGDWLLFLIYLKKHIAENSNNNTEKSLTIEEPLVISLKYFKLEGVHKYIAGDIIISYIIYFGVGGFIHWWFYVYQRDHPENWKCQPKKWLSPDLEKHEIKLGARNVGIGSIVYGTLACYIDNGGYTSLYFSWNEYGWIYLIVSIVLIFLYQEAGAYYVHRLLHVPYFYKRFHKVHHLYKQPTPFSATAMHIVDMILFQSVMLIPMFLFPIHAAVYYIDLFYMYYYGIVTHSGVDIKSIWPWQPDVMFHDNHHQYFHVNYGANMTLWDKIHSTYRCKNRIYSEEIFGGKGKDLACATKEEREMYKSGLENEIKRYKMH